jgi:Cyclin, C-terminal domain
VDARHDILELARFLTELSVIDYFFVVHRPSIVAYAAVITAMEEVPGASSALHDFAEEINNFSHLRFDNEDLLECRTRLRHLYAQGAYTRPVAILPGSREESISPVCVSYVYQPHDFAQISYNTEDY